MHSSLTEKTSHSSHIVTSNSDQKNVINKQIWFEAWRFMMGPMQTEGVAI